MSAAGYSAHDTARLVSEAPKSAALPLADDLPERAPFARDRARVLHSASFRRLAGKTQVVAPDEDDVPRTRLTHSLEVAQIARDIGEHLGADPDLVDLAGLAHDIGHPPFGHNGETALDAVGVAAGGFEANAQNLRLLTRLETKVLDADGAPAGLNLTRAALDAVLKYPWTRPPGGGKFGVYAEELAVFDWLRDGVPDPTARCLESQIMDWADDVAYSVHDVEDGVLSGRIDLRALASADERRQIAEVASTWYLAVDRDTLRHRLDDLLGLPAVADGLRAAVDDRWATGAAAVKAVTSELTGRFVTGAVAATRTHAGEGELHRYDTDLVVPDTLRAEVAVLKAMAAHYVMADPERRTLQVRQQQVLTELVTATADRPEELLDPLFLMFWKRAADDAGRLRVVLDQVSLLTDAQALHRHRRLAPG
ncbi:deoxyguanosinetriphosphate triphosphohydrolase [Nakamurella sp. YIM 132087]|uniref:Deoxyguanosinetriphosphate triphosphohydrolase-like protein n=1 Tax=Nakamurella alba TaxID=2665158 RepID=A0A7K1FJW5_9ACTN|nr:deoxyguanosinetriphosphate triphosphohydrolase [Nakamurella alba]MTD13543.1 deoxyguanosinetriphosphate triphosphohydrolase [Nakamurella alba]